MTTLYPTAKHYLSRDHHTQSFGSEFSPALRVAAGDQIHVQTWDCYKGQVLVDADLTKVIDDAQVNPATGPIYVEGADNTEEHRMSPGERYGKVYQINYLRCVFCGLCIEACPTRALTMTNEYELADDTRAKLIFEKQDLLAPLRQGMLMPPHPMYPEMTDTNYYNGDVKGAHPSQAKNPGDIQS